MIVIIIIIIHPTKLELVLINIASIRLRKFCVLNNNMKKDKKWSKKLTWYNLLEDEKIISAISQSHSTDNSYAFFITPNLRLLNVT